MPSESVQAIFLQKFFASSPAVRLIRSPHAFWIVDFLNQQFKLVGKITRTHSELAMELDSYLDRLAKEKILADVKLDSRDKADTYLNSWCSGSIGWMKRFVEEGATEPSYQLTSEFEKALAFVNRASKEQGFIGTESRLRSILDTLGTIVSGTNMDPAERLRQLEQQKSAIEAEIATVKSSVPTAKLNPTQIQERFSLAIQHLQQLKSEFRAVEDRFRSITRDVQQRVMAAADSRGEILQFALDSEDTLKQGHQGQSFFEFLKLLHSPENQDRINRLVQELSEIESLAENQAELSELRQMVPTLIAEAEKILRTTQNLSRTLRRLLDSRSTQHHQQLSQVLRDILGAATNLSETPPSTIGLDIEVELEIQCPMDRPFWEATDPFEEVELLASEPDPKEQAAALAQLANLERLDWQVMRHNIASLTEHGEATLESVLDRFPIETGAIEILGYLQIAHDDGHQIDRSQVIEIPASRTGPLGRNLTLPNVVFLPPHARQHADDTNEQSTIQDRVAASNSSQ